MKISRNLEEKKLLAALKARGASGPWASAIQVWSGFKDYGSKVALGGGTGLLFQVGTYNFDGRPKFYFDPVCQFELVDDDGEHDGYEQLHCELSCPPTPALTGVQATLWSFEFNDAQAFFTAKETLPEFNLAVANGSYRLHVSYESV